MTLRWTQRAEMWEGHPGAAGSLLQLHLWTHLQLSPLWSKCSWKGSCLSYPLLCPQQGACSLAHGRHLLKQDTLTWKNGDLHSGLSGRTEWRSIEEDSGGMRTQTLPTSSPCSVPACLLLSKWLLRAVGSWPSKAGHWGCLSRKTGGLPSDANPYRMDKGEGEEEVEVFYMSYESTG